jgi:hypothetical protein
MGKPVQFYYRNADISFESSSTVILSETIDCEGLESHVQCLQLYLQGPSSDRLVSPFPDGLQLRSVHMEGQDLIVVMSEELAQLSGLELMIACGCIASTCMELTGAQRIVIRAENERLDGKYEIILDKDSLLLLDTSLPKE